jgi:hypothetical protein
MARPSIILIEAACGWVLLAFALHMGGKEAACGKCPQAWLCHEWQRKQTCMMVCKHETIGFIHLQKCWMADKEDFLSSCECATVLATLQSHNPESVLVSCTDSDGNIIDGQSLGTACGPVCQDQRCIYYMALNKAEEQWKKNTEGRSCALCGMKAASRYRQVPGDMLQAIRAFTRNKLRDEIVSQQRLQSKMRHFGTGSGEPHGKPHSIVGEYHLRATAKRKAPTE